MTSGAILTVVEEIIQVGEVLGRVMVPTRATEAQRLVKVPNCPHSPKMTYVHALSASSSSKCKAKNSRILRGALSERENGSSSLVGSKRPCSPKESTCGCCFRASYKTADC